MARNRQANRAIRYVQLDARSQEEMRLWQARQRPDWRDKADSRCNRPMPEVFAWGPAYRATLHSADILEWAGSKRINPVAPKWYQVVKQDSTDFVQKAQATRADKMTY